MGHLLDKAADWLESDDSTRAVTWVSMAVLALGWLWLMVHLAAWTLR